MNVPVLFIGLIFFTAGIMLIVKQSKSKKSNTESAMAEVTSYHTEVEHDTDNMTESYVYYPVVKYYANGQWIEVRSDIGSGKKKYNPEEKIEIFYNPDKPKEFIIAGDKSKYFIGIVSAAAGLGVMILSLFIK